MKTINIDQAIKALKDGQVIIYPTETFFAIGCDVLHKDAIAKVFLVKKRNNNMPLPVIIGSLEQLEMISDAKMVDENSVTYADETRRALVRSFWPASLSILFPAKKDIPVLLTGGTGYVAVRLTPHEAARKLCHKLGHPLISSSANISGTAPVYSPEEIDQGLLSVIDGGFFNALPSPKGGLPSTVVEAIEDGKMSIRIRRAGAITNEMLESCGFIIVR